MKKCIAIAAMAISTLTYAQMPERIMSKKGSTITLTATATMTTDMGMGMEMNNNNSNTYVIDILDVTDQNITVAYTLKRLAIAMEAMGQQNNYDSDKPEDRNSEMGKSIPEKMYQPDTIQIDRLTGKILQKKENEKAAPEADDNPLAGMMQAFGNSDQSGMIQEIFFVIPKGIKTGGQWQDSIVDKGLKKTRTYTLISQEKETATVAFMEQAVINTESDMQGMTVQVNMTGNTTGTVLVNSKSGLVDKRTAVADITGTVEVMGQSSPISSKSTTTLQVQY